MLSRLEKKFSRLEVKPLLEVELMFHGAVFAAWTFLVAPIDSIELLGNSDVIPGTPDGINSNSDDIKSNSVDILGLEEKLLEAIPWCKGSWKSNNDVRLFLEFKVLNAVKVSELVGLVVCGSSR